MNVRIQKLHHRIHITNKIIIMMAVGASFFSFLSGSLQKFCFFFLTASHAIFLQILLRLLPAAHSLVTICAVVLLYSTFVRGAHITCTHVQVYLSTINFNRNIHQMRCNLIYN